jgi:hypothetical protein
MNEIIVTNTQFEYLKIFDWLFKNCNSKWKTIDRGDLLGKTDIQWKEHIKRLIANNKQSNLGDNLVTGNFEFENPQDAMLFKLRWGGR